MLAVRSGRARKDQRGCWQYAHDEQEKTSEVAAGSTVQYSTLMSSKEGEDMSQVNHSFGDGPLVLFSGLFLLATFVGELGKRQGEYKHKKQ